MSQESSSNGSQGLPEADRVVEYMREKAERPLSEKAIRKQFEVEEGQSSDLSQLLTRLEESGRLVKTRDNRYGVPDKMNLVVGTLSCHADGYGFVMPRHTDEKDLYVSGRKLGTAMHGDLVVARKEHVRRSGKVEGRIIRVLERERQQVVGTFSRSKNFGTVVPLDKRMVWEVYVPEDEVGDAEPGKVVCAEITEYPEGSRNPEGKIVEVLGELGDPKIDVEIIIREHELPHTFPDEVVAEAEKIAGEVTEEQLEGREDFRDVPVVTIDGENARDFDDAVHVRKLESGNFELGVHIADVSAYVDPGSVIDQEARRRGTSVYFPDRVVPMLPERLSNEICSLKPGVDRLVQSVVMQIDPDGNTVDYRFHDGVLRSSERMTYTDVFKILEDDEEVTKKYSDHVEHFQVMSRLCDLLRGYRSRRGSIDFDLPEPEILIDITGKVEDVLRSERNKAHRIIEEFMIRANEVVASHLIWEDVPALFRVHDGPDEERVESFREFIDGLGLGLGGGKSPEPRHFQRLVEQLEGKPGERVVVYQMLRTMKQAVYQEENTGHFGLASPRYTHFTSPIRRYPDLVIHRLLRAERARYDEEGKSAAAAPSEVAGDLEAIASDCSRKERTAEAAERQYIDWKKVQFMQDKVGDEFEALITGVHSFGFFVELERFFVEGLVHVSTLDDDYYEYQESEHRLRGRNSGRVLALGNRVKVQLTKVDRERRRLDFGLIEGPIEPAIKPAEERKGGDKREPKPRRHGRKRRSKGGKKDSKGDRQQKKSDEDAKGGKQESKGSGRSRRRRRKKDSGGGKRQQKGDAKEQRADAKKGGGRRRKKSGGKGRQEQRDKGGRQESKGKDDQRGRGSRKGRGKGGNGSGGGEKQRSRSSDKKQEKKAQEQPKPEQRKPEVNPYLTDL